MTIPYLDVFAKIVGIADEIRENIKAKGEEAERQFEEAVARNKKSFADILHDLGGEPPPDHSHPPPLPIEPPVYPPVEPPPDVPRDPTTIAYNTLDEAKEHVTSYYTIVIERDGKFYVWPGAFPYSGTKVYPK